MALKIVVTGDIHIGKRSTAVPENDMVYSARHTWESIVGYSVENDMDAVVLTGDVIDRNNRFFEATAPFEAGLDKLAMHSIPVYMVAGNHDYDVLASIVSMKERRLVHLLGKSGKWDSRIFTKGGESIQFIGWSFPREHYPDNPVNLLGDMQTGTNSAVTLALVHGDIQGNKSKYAALDPAQLKSIQGIDAWLLGHIHKPTVLNGSNPLILYPGSPQAFSPKEQGCHGLYVLTVENKKISCEQIPLSPVLYINICINFSPEIKEEDIKPAIYRRIQTELEGIDTGTPLKTVVADIDLSGTSPFAGQITAMEKEIADYEGNFPFKVIIRTVSVSVFPGVPVSGLLSDPSYLGILARIIDDILNDRDTLLLSAMIEEWKTKYQQAFTGNTYDVLKATGVKDDIDRYARSFILEESKRLISELYNQKAHAN